MRMNASDLTFEHRIATEKLENTMMRFSGMLVLGTVLLSASFDPAPAQGLNRSSAQEKAKTVERVANVKCKYVPYGEYCNKCTGPAAVPGAKLCNFKVNPQPANFACSYTRCGFESKTIGPPTVRRF
jgi:hypothetical protein